MYKLIASHELGEILVRYVQPEGSNRCELSLIPISCRDDIEQPRKLMNGRVEIDNLPSKFHPILADTPGSLVQLKLKQDDTGMHFSSGLTLLESATMDALEYVEQEVVVGLEVTEIKTFLEDSAKRFRCIHRLSYREGDAGLRTGVEFINTGNATLELELLTSFALNGLTPYSRGSCTKHLQIHRFRTWWSMEGRKETTPLESMHMERSWAGTSALTERFGQVGTMPSRKWFSTAAVEDLSQGVVWAAQLAWAGSWQMKLYRRGDRVSLYGGLADREFGHWTKKVLPGETFVSPSAYLTSVRGTLDDACEALLDGQREALANLPESELTLPVCFNEWCTSWGNPTHENVLAAASRLQGSGVRYVVIDDGWAKRPAEVVMQSNGDWEVDLDKFPNGLKATCDELREMGFIPGLWFEFEVVNPGSNAWSKYETSFLLRDGRPLRVGTRRFWDLNDPRAIEYLSQKVIGLLKLSGFGYLKVDYNDNIGLGSDHPDSLGEGLRRQVEGIYQFFRAIREAMPDLVIENCSSGGHRLEPSMQGLTSMGSFSDAHESTVIPIIAKNLQRLILPQQSLIWAVLHVDDSNDRIYYSLAATFLGRVCISGEIHRLSNQQIRLLTRALSLYADIAEVLRFGRSSFFDSGETSYVDPRGWQIVVRNYQDQLLVVGHAFESDGSISVEVELPSGAWEVQHQLCSQSNYLELKENCLAALHFGSGFQGGVWILKQSLNSAQNTV